MLEIVPADSMRYKYANEAWVPVGRAEVVYTNPPYLHHDCPCLGEELMRKQMSFARVKLTNRRDLSEGKVSNA